MTFLELQNLVWTWLDDPTHGYFSPDEVKRWLNNAQREAQKKLLQTGQQWYTKLAYTNVVADIDTYSLPDDFLEVNHFQILLSGTTPNQNRQSLSPVPLVDIDRVSMTTGTPSAYTIRRNCVVFRPIPANTYTVYLDYSYMVADMVGPTDIPDVPTQYHEYLAVLATIDGFLKDQNDPSPMLTKKDYYEKLMERDANNRNVDYPRQVVMVDDGDIGFLY